MNEKPSIQGEGWEATFRNEFTFAINTGIESFISNLLKDQAKGILERVRLEKRVRTYNDWDEAYNDALSWAEKIIKELL